MTVLGRDDDVLAVRSDGHALTFADLTSDSLRLREMVLQSEVATVSTRDAAVVAAAVAALDGWAAEVRLVPPGPAASHEPAVVRSAPTSDVGAGDVSTTATRWVLYTSGTTGQPKEIVHTLASLSRTVVARPDRPMTWGLLYDPNRMAGMQVLLQGLLSGSSVIAPAIDLPLPDRIQRLVESDVDALSATPTLWRLILQVPAATEWSLRQITLGGEIADQKILDALAHAFPDARIVHVFASTETGAAFSVRDGRAGFPVAYLDDPPNGIRLEIRDGILFVHSPGVSAAGPDGFASTGDVVEVVGNRVEFRGRGSGVVNVGGSNVWPEVVEAILRDHPDVLDVVVSAKANAMTGNVLVARVQLTGVAEPDGVSKRLRSWVRDRAPSTHVPATIAVVDDLGVSITGKVKR